MNAVKAPFARQSEERASAVGEKVHSDIKEVPIGSFNQHKYAICFVDCFSRRASVYAMKQKSEAVDKFRQYVEECAAVGIHIRGLRSDNGSEYTSSEMETFCLTRKGPKGEALPILQSYSPPYCQSANGVSEVFWRDTFRLVRTILWDQQRSAKYWAVAMQFACEIRNHLVTAAVVEGVPESVFTGKPVDVSHFRVPLADCYAYVEKENRGHSDLNVPKTLDEQRRKLIFVGYASNSGCYQCLDPGTLRVYNRRFADVEFRGESSRAPVGADPKVPLVDDLEAALEIDVAQARQRGNSTTIQPTRKEITAADVDGVRFVTLSQDRSVAELARLFNVDPETYLSFIREFDGWYKEITHSDNKVTAGSDVPVNISGRYENVVDVDEPPMKSRKLGQRKRVATRLSKRALTGKARPRTRSMAVAYRAIQNEYDELEQLWAEGLSENMGQVSDTDGNRASKLQQAFAAAASEGVRPGVTPKSHRQAVRIDEKEGNRDWEQSEESEWNGLWKSGCFSDEKYRGQKLHHLLWVYKIKSCGRRKSRLTLDGRNQDPSTYGDIRSPTMRLASMRTLLAIAATNQWDVYADDATQAFINALRPEERPMWASYPEPFRKPGHCMLVRRMIYGCHDSPKGWFDCLRQHMVEDQSFTQSETDECLFTKDGIAVVVHVDDFLSTGTDAALKDFRDRIRDRFKMTGGRVTEYFGLDVEVNPVRGRATLSAKSYIGRMIVKLGITPKKWRTPMEVDAPLPKLRGECMDKQLHKRYRSLVGSIMHPAVTCRPDVAAAVRALSQHLVHPGPQHLRAAERAIQYLHATKDLAMIWSKDSDTGFYGTCDASFNTEQGAKSVTGWEYHLGGAAISWKSSVQGLVTLSSCEAELVACDAAVRELRGLRKLLEDFGVVFEHPILLAQDNMSTMTIIKSRHFSGRTKHVDLRYHHCADQQKLGLMNTQYLESGEMTADALTKPLPAEAHEKHRAVLMGHARVSWPVLTRERSGLPPERTRLTKRVRSSA